MAVNCCAHNQNIFSNTHYFKKLIVHNLKTQAITIKYGLTDSALTLNVRIDLTNRKSKI